MRDTQLVMYDEDFRKVLAVTQRLVADANAKGVFIVDRNGQLISEAGEMRGVDTTSLASLTAGSVAATGGLAKIVGEEEFPVHFHQGQRDNLHITLIAGRIILVVIFDDRSSLGLVRLRVKKAGAQLAKVFEEIQKRADQGPATGVGSGGGGGAPFAEITDEDIDNLFSV
jgi:predicted regulator of Ras-like GTPase activity (Roadblock/LC7/MglB family)